LVAPRLAHKVLRPSIAAGLIYLLLMGYGLFFGLAVGLTFSTAEPFTGFLICLAILLHRRYRWGAALMFGLASLSRETALLFPVGYLIFYCVRKEWRPALAMALFGIAPLAVWLMFLRLVFGETGLGFAPAFEPLPFLGILVQSETPRKFILLIITILIPAAAALFLGVRELLRGRFDPVLLSFILNAILVVFLSRLSTTDLVSPGRIAVGMMLGGVAYAATNKGDVIAVAFLYNIITFILYLAGVLAGIQSLYL
jgi:hypothetical protein